MTRNQTLWFEINQIWAYSTYRRTLKFNLRLKLNIYLKYNKLF